MRQVLRAGALGRPKGMGWTGRQEGESGRGTHVNPWLTHVNGWQKPLQYCKVISLQQIKINEKKKKKEDACLISGSALGEEMATHYTVLAWRIPWTGEPDGLQTMGLQRVGHN